MSWEVGYLNLLERVLREGHHYDDRTGTGATGLFAPGLLQVDLREGFPLVTTKLVRIGPVAEELAWFLRGEDNVRSLQRRGVRFWDPWAAESDGYVGPMYGFQWRSWPRYSHGKWRSVDQIKAAEYDLKETPSSRRILVSAWNVAALADMALPPCHHSFQLRAEDAKWLDMLVHIRSWDLFIGGPFNVASYALLLQLFARSCGMRARRLVICPGDAHVYDNHMEQVHVQLRRRPFDPPQLLLDSSVGNVDQFDGARHVYLQWYEHWPELRGEVAV